MPQDSLETAETQLQPHESRAEEASATPEAASAAPRGRVGLLAVLALAAIAICAGVFWALNAYDRGSQVTPDKSGSAEAKELGLTPGVAEYSRVDDYTLTGEQLKVIASFHSIRSLSIEGCSSLSDQDLDALAGLNQLNSLSLRRVGVGPDGLKTVGKLTTLTSLDLGLNDELTDESLSELEKLTELTYLSLEGCTGVGDEGLAHLKTLSKLESLDLSWCPAIGSEELASVVRSLPALKHLNIGNTPHSDALIRGMLEGTHLKTLDLRNTPNITDKAVTALKAAQPNCEVMR